MATDQLRLAASVWVVYLEQATNNSALHACSNAGNEAVLTI
jgi:hypothetical protein